MGIFDKVKSFANKLTGGSAKVFVESDPIKFGEPFQVRIKAIVQDEGIQIDRVYLNVVGLEEVRVHDTDVHHSHDGQTRSRSETIHRTHQTEVSSYRGVGYVFEVACIGYLCCGQGGRQIVINICNRCATA